MKPKFCLARVLPVAVVLTLLSNYSLGVDPLPTSMKGHFGLTTVQPSVEKGGGDWSIQISKDFRRRRV